MYSSKTTEPLQRIYRLRTLQHSQFCSAKEEQHMYSSKTTETCRGSTGLGLFSISQFCSAKEDQHTDSSKTIGDPVEDLQA
jgi:hypothetical protein